MINTILLHIDILEEIWHVFHFIFNIIIGIVGILAIIFVPYFVGKFVTNDNLYDEIGEWFIGLAIVAAICLFIYGCWYYA